MTTNLKSTAPLGQTQARGVFAFQEDTLMGDVADSLRNLAEITPKLNRVTDAVNAAFRATEDILGKLGIGLDGAVGVGGSSESSTPLKDEDGNRTGSNRNFCDQLFLVYERMSGRYRLGFKVQHTEWVGEDEDVNEFLEPMAWDQAPRSMKLKGVQEIAALLAEITAEAESLLSAGDAAAIRVQELLSTISDTDPSSKQ